MSTKRIHASRPVALATCLLFSAALLVAWTHRLAVDHGFCSDHGRLIHLPAGLRRLPPHDPQQKSLHRDRHLSGIHDCAALAFLMTPWDRPPGFQSAASIGGHPLKEAVTDYLSAPPIPLLHQAPKMSPPRG
jgi:hypothetical protein